MSVRVTSHAKKVPTVVAQRVTPLAMNSEFNSAWYVPLAEGFDYICSVELTVNKKCVEKDEGHRHHNHNDKNGNGQK